VLKLLLPMVAALVAQASIVTTATCTAGTQTTSLQNASDPLSCFGTGQSLFATGFTAYRVSAEATTNHLSVDARGGFLNFVGDSVIARAEASLVGTDSVIFPGSGPGDTEANASTHFIGVPQDSSGGFGFAVNGLSQSVAMPIGSRPRNDIHRPGLLDRTWCPNGVPLGCGDAGRGWARAPRVRGH
jgi:hypothetical protein